MAFPTSPTDGQIATVNGIRYAYSTTNNSWTRQATASAILSIVTDTFTADGVTTSYNLSTTPYSTDFVTINIDGVSQQKSAYTLSTNIITFTSTPIINSVIEVRSTVSTNTSVLTGLNYDSFTGNGTTTAFTLSVAPVNENYTIVTIGGITQNKSVYSVSGTTLTFATAPPNTAPIEVTTFGPAINTSPAVGSNTQIQFNSNGAMGANANLTFNTSTSTLTTTNIVSTGDVSVAGNVSVTNDLFVMDISSTGNITNTGNVTSNGTITALNIAATNSMTVAGTPVATGGKIISMSIVFGG